VSRYAAALANALARKRLFVANDARYEILMLPLGKLESIKACKVAAAAELRQR